MHREKNKTRKLCLTKSREILGSPSLFPERNVKVGADVCTLHNPKKRLETVHDHSLIKIISSLLRMRAHKKLKPGHQTSCTHGSNKILHRRKAQTPPSLTIRNELSSAGQFLNNGCMIPSLQGRHLRKVPPPEWQKAPPVMDTPANLSCATKHSF